MSYIFLYSTRQIFKFYSHTRVMDDTLHTRKKWKKNQQFQIKRSVFENSCNIKYAISWVFLLIILSTNKNFSFVSLNSTNIAIMWRKENRSIHFSRSLYSQTIWRLAKVSGNFQKKKTFIWQMTHLLNKSIYSIICLEKSNRGLSLIDSFCCQTHHSDIWVFFRKPIINVRPFIIYM